MSKKYFKVRGGNKLNGKVTISGAKNSVLALLIASVLTDKQLVIEDVPAIKDVFDLVEILEYLGANIIVSDQGERKIITIDNKNLEYKPLLIEQITRFRASYYLMGVMLGRFGKCELLIPGGCFLGPRPIDLHLKGFESLGCEIEEFEHEGNEALRITAKSGRIEADTIFLDFPSVGATINLLLASAISNGTTILENAAKEPEIVDVITLLNTMGANIRGGGTGVIRIEGREALKGCYHQVIPDRIEAGSYLMLAGLLGENVIIDNVIPEHLDAVVSKLEQIGINMTIEIDRITVTGRVDKLSPVKIQTGVYPSFATDLQQVMATMLTQVDGYSEITETIYPDRFKNCHYLNDMGANIEIKRSENFGQAKIEGGTKLSGEVVEATDLRAGFSLLFAGLVAEGETEVHNINHVLRGYANIVKKLQNLGADIELIEE
ncbi:UDP-N-acetylglucosamine 1-carboxyvinyltransferase [Mollicutes bacterium LVI A0039]|nr:UDP-N-acetylglucosamine 1-carboxyvinyltransferase [Mollicutes bacterium LVI A0039]